MIGKVKVLLVEDEYDFAFLVEDEIARDKRLEYLGHAFDSLAGVEAACRLEPDIVVLDLYLEGSYHDGIEAAREIRIKTDAKIMFLTGFEQRDIMYEACSKAFASGYIFKSQIHDIADSIYDTATKETPLKLAFQKNVRDGLTPAQQFVLDGLMGENTGAFNYSSIKTIANHKTVIFRKLGLKNEKELLHVFRNW